MLLSFLLLLSCVVQGMVAPKFSYIHIYKYIHIYSRGM